MKRNLLLSLLVVILLCGGALPLLTNADTQTKKEISATPPQIVAGLGSNFTDINTADSLELGKEYWVRLTVNGKDGASQVYSGSDIMLVLDVTGSMTSQLPIGTSAPGEYTTRMQAAKQSLTNFINNAQESDRIGFASFVVCAPVSGQYAHLTYSIPMSWVYEGNMPDGLREGYGYLHYPLQPVTNEYKSQLNNLLSQTGTVGSLQFTDDINFCDHPVSIPTSTDPGGGLIVGLSQLTDIIQSQRRTVSMLDQTLFKSSSAGQFQQPRYRIDKKKYIVLATDGKENRSPLTYDSQSIIQQLNLGGIDNAVQYAVNKQIVIYSLTIGNASVDKLRQASQDTGGQYFSGTTRDNLLNAYTNIYNQVQENTELSQIIVEEKINNQFFQISDLNPTSPTLESRFRIAKFSGGVEADVTRSLCENGRCINRIAADHYSFDLPAIPSTDKYYIYFKVQTIRASEGAAIPVDSTESKVVYSPSDSVLMSNKQVTIQSALPFFQVSEGSFYSNANVVNNLIASESMMTGSESIAYHNNGLNVGEGQATQRRMNPSYEFKFKENYEYFEKLLENQTVVKDLADKIVINRNDLSPFSPAGIDSDSTILIVKLKNDAKRFVYNDPSMFSDKRTRIVFIDGDLYLSKNFSIPSTGNNSVTFIVSGNIGIDPSVTNLEGLFIADGVIDTACSKDIRFGGDNTCGPDSAPDPLRIEGSLISLYGGFQFDREGVTNTLPEERKPGEMVVYRPDLILNVSQVIGKVSRTWTEVAD